MNNRYECVFIGVNYCSSNEAFKWVESVLKLLGNKLIIIMDNSAEKTDKELESRVLGLSSEIVYINTKVNMGYLAAADYALKKLQDKQIQFDFLVVSNVDLKFITQEFIKKLYGMSNADVAIIAPAIIDNGRDLNPYRIVKPTKKEMQRRVLYFKYYYIRGFIDILRKIKRKMLALKKKKKVEEGTAMYMPYGACFIFTKEYFSAGGNLEHEVFLYAEESFVAEQCIRINKKIIYAPSLQIENIGHVSVSKIKSKVLNKYILEAAEYVLKNYY